MARFVEAAFWLYLVVFSATLVRGQLGSASSEILAPLAAYAAKFFGLFLIATTIPWSSPTFSHVNRLLFVLLTPLVSIGMASGALSGILLGPTSDVEALDYHGLALSYTLISIVGISSVRVASLRSLLWLVAIAGLFLIGARSEFVGFAIAVISIELIQARGVGRKIRLLYLPLGVSMIGLLFAEEIFSTDSRMLGLIEIADDESAIQRSFMNDAAWQTILDHPLLGDFASYRPGEYAHNVTSAWVDLGLPGFLLLLVLLFFPLGSLLTNARLRDHGVGAVAVGIAAMCAILVCVSKTYFYQLIPVSTGLFVYHCRQLVQRRS